MIRTALALLVTIAAAAPLQANAAYAWNSRPDSPDASNTVLSTGAMDAMAAFKAKQAAQDAQQAQRDQERAQLEDAQRARNAEAAAARAHELEVRNSPAGHVAGAEQQIRYCTARISEARDALQRENQIEKESGVQNLTIRYRAGSEITYCNGQIKAAFREYRQYGGTASSPDALVKQLISESQ